MQTTNQARTLKIYPFIFSLLLIAAGLVAIFLFKLDQPASAAVSRTVISQQILAEKYGVHVNLAAVTAAGGMVDLRLKFIDGKKARLLLQEKQNFPALLAGDVLLNVDADTKSQAIQFEDNGGLYLMFPNSGNAVKPGGTVSIVFGALQLEAIVVR
jgi:hypothetical protein